MTDNDDDIDRLDKLAEDGRCPHCGSLECFSEDDAGELYCSVTFEYIL